jgi:hypothetical protein
MQTIRKDVNSQLRQHPRESNDYAEPFQKCATHQSMTLFHDLAPTVQLTTLLDDIVQILKLITNE